MTGGMTMNKRLENKELVRMFNEYLTFFKPTTAYRSGSYNSFVQPSCREENKSKYLDDIEPDIHGFNCRTDFTNLFNLKSFADSPAPSVAYKIQNDDKFLVTEGFNCLFANEHGYFGQDGVPQKYHILITAFHLFKRFLPHNVLVEQWAKAFRDMYFTSSLSRLGYELEKGKEGVVFRDIAGLINDKNNVETHYIHNKDYVGIEIQSFLPCEDGTRIITFTLLLNSDRSAEVIASDVSRRDEGMLTHLVNIRANYSEGFWVLGAPRVLLNSFLEAE